MRFEIEVDIPAGYEPTGEYRAPNVGECYLMHGASWADVASFDTRERRLILRKKPLAYEDFSIVGVDGIEVAVDHEGDVVFGRNGKLYARPDDARALAAAMIAAADHVDRVNAQKAGV